LYITFSEITNQIPLMLSLLEQMLETQMIGCDLVWSWQDCCIHHIHLKDTISEALDAYDTKEAI